MLITLCVLHDETSEDDDRGLEWAAVAAVFEAEIEKRERI
jgi:hypothetical protein